MLIEQINSESELDALLEKNSVVIVDFYADWCPPCKAIAPKFEKLATEMSGVKFAKVNIDKLQSIARKYEIRSIPTFIIFKAGKTVRTMVGESIDNIKMAIMSQM